jgi:tight adherence protein C
VISLHDLVPLAAFLSIALGVWGVLSVFGNRDMATEQRLHRLVQRSKGRKPGTALLIRDQERLQNKVAAAATKLAKPMQPKNEAELGKLRSTMLNAGFRHPHAVQIFLGLKLAALLLGLAIAVPIAATQTGFNRNGLMLIVSIAGVIFYIPGLVVGRMKKKRQEAIFLGLPDALDLMVVCVEAGLGFDAAMRRVTSELANACPTLCDEFNIVNFQIQMGRPRREALRELGLRTGVDDVRALAGVIIQAEKFGSSIGTALRVQSDSMRVRRRQLAEERAAKTAVKIMIPLILFIFPGVFVVLVGPAALKIVDTILKT